MSEYEIASLNLQEASLNLQEIVTWGTVAYTAIAFMTFCLIGYGIYIMNRSNNKRSEAIEALNERIFHADERRHKEAMAAHKEFMEAHKAAHEESMKRSMAAHEESMTALKALIANGEETSKALVEILRRTSSDAPAAPAGAG